jgi:hypothetical protein
VIVALAFVCSSLLNSTPGFAASSESNGGVVASHEHQHTVDGGDFDLHINASDLELDTAFKADSEDCAPGKKHHDFSSSSADCCAAICLGMTVLPTNGFMCFGRPADPWVDSYSSVYAVVPVGFMRPPRA